MSVRTKSTVDRRSGTFLADMWNTDVQFRAVSRLMYSVGAKSRTPKTAMGTRADGVPSLHYFSRVANRGLQYMLDHLCRDKRVGKQDPKKQDDEGDVKGGHDGESQTSCTYVSAQPKVNWERTLPEDRAHGDDLECAMQRKDLMIVFDQTVAEEAVRPTTSNARSSVRPTAAFRRDAAAVNSNATITESAETTIKAVRH